MLWPTVMFGSQCLLFLAFLASAYQFVVRELTGSC
jgi:hypothetical protein